MMNLLSLRLSVLCRVYWKLEMSKSNVTSSSLAPASLTEHLSALLDDEAGDFEQRRVLDELKLSDELRQKLSSYSLIGEVMRTGQMAPVAADGGFLAGIHDKINSEDEYHQVQLEDKQEKPSKSWLRPVGGFALAASVAAVSVIGFQNYQQMDKGGFVTASIDAQVSSQKDRLSVAKMNSATVVSADQLVSNNEQLAMVDKDFYQPADAQTRLLLKRYVDSHMQQASTTAFVPSVRVIAYAD
jgi:sigma-E factor negative regulatory protein RseA